MVTVVVIAARMKSVLITSPGPPSIGALWEFSPGRGFPNVGVSAGGLGLE